MSIISYNFVKNSPNTGKRANAGKIENWILVKSRGYVLVYGNIVHDHLGRFQDGEYIHTSYVCDFAYDPETKSGGIFTRNSIYDLGAVKEGFKFESFLKD